LALLVLGLLPVVRFKTYPAERGAQIPLAAFRAGHGRYELHAFTGTLEGVATRTATDVITTTYADSGRAPEVRTVSTVYDRLTLVDDSGTKQSFEVADFHVASAPGHRLTVVWATRPRGKSGPYVAVLDRSSGQGFFRYQSWGLFLGPGRMLVVVGIALLIALPLALVSMGLAFGIPFAAGFMLRHFTRRNIATFRARIMRAPA
jgi:hypothetical protein